LNPKIIDTHAHLDMTEFDKDRDQVINRAREAGVATIVTIGINLESCRQTIELTKQYPDIWAAVGIHPQDTNNIKQRDIDELETLAKNPRVVAIGEIGLDFYRNYSPRQDQFNGFMSQLELSHKLGLPIIIHCRQAQEEMIPILQNWAGSFKLLDGRPRGVIHCFSGDKETAKKYIEIGFYVSFGAYIGYSSSLKLRDTIKNIPLEKIVIETDCPFLPPQKYRGQRNEPVYSLITAGLLAEIKQLPIEDIAYQTTQNALRLFNLPGT
jgi:TatD DNase family protein